jgi:putative ABC transport system ATP-binding protein
MDRLQEVRTLMENPAATERTTLSIEAQPAMINIERASRRYHDGQQDVWALRNLNLTIPKGQIAAIVGKSGSGKSTLLHLMAGLDLPDSGSITIAGKVLQSMNEDERTAFRLREVGLVFQFFHLLPGLTALENVMFPAELAGWSRNDARSRAAELLASVQLPLRAKSYPDRMSGGEQQRVAIARALVLLPPVLLADEPTGNLDTETGETIAALLLDLARRNGVTMVIATHSAELARNTDRIIEIRAGHIVADAAAVPNSLQKSTAI